MDATVAKGAAILLDFVGSFESDDRYDVVYGGHQAGLSRSITSTSIDALLDLQAIWGRKWGSSAAGRYQCMPNTIIAAKARLGLTGKELFSPDMQDRIGYDLLKNRGYALFKQGKLSTTDFGRHLAMEWASMPVLDACQGAHRRVARGETYYAGDRLNRALVQPEKVEAILAKVHAATN